MLIDDGVLLSDDADGAPPAVLSAIAVPPTIQALIAARLDRLGPSERTVIQAASIEGKEFVRGGVEALVADGGPTARCPHARAHSQGPRPPRRRQRGPVPVPPPAHPRRGLRGGASKDLRADMHERFADWLGATSSSPAHRRRAGRISPRTGGAAPRRELGAPEAATAELAARACARLRAAGRRSTLRDDPAAVSLIERALGAGAGGGACAAPRRARRRVQRRPAIWSVALQQRPRRWSSRARRATGGPLGMRADGTAEVEVRPLGGRERSRLTPCGNDPRPRRARGPRRRRGS